GSNGIGIDPLMMYMVGAEINRVQWSALMSDWIAIAFDDKATASESLSLICQENARIGKANTLASAAVVASYVEAVL
ncbi:hypothetical protein Tco_0253506, partial [Tanacetum coccineum]